MKIVLRISVLLVIHFNGSLHAKDVDSPPLFKHTFSIDVKKTGPYIGIQRGKYTVLVLGVERQWKEIKLQNARTHAAHA